jgi:hypothetical protein
MGYARATEAGRPELKSFLDSNSFNVSYSLTQQKTITLLKESH